MQSFQRGGFALSEEELKKRRALAQRRNRNKPMNFGAAAQMNVPTLAQPRQDITVQPLPPTPQGRPGGNAGQRIDQQLNFQEGMFQPDPQVPILNDQPPVPGSDEAILQGSSQQVEKAEEDLSLIHISEPTRPY